MKPIDLDYYWMSKAEWFFINDKGMPEMREDAPEEAKKSLEHFLEQCKDIKTHLY